MNTADVLSVEHELFKEAYAQRKAPLTIIMGSGLSAPANLPTWPQLRKKLEERIAQQLASRQLAEALTRDKLATLDNTSDPWLAFKLIKEILTPPVFEALVESYLSPPPGTEIPDAYLELTKLQPRGFVTLNLDRFAGDALAASRSLGYLTPIYGREIASKWNVVIGDKPHLVYLHGDLLNPSTWVMTYDDLKDVLDSPSHALFLHNTFLNNIVLFVGVSADDLALSSRLIDLRAAGFRPKNLFWLTSRRDADTTDWAAQNYIKLIKYDATTNEHHLRAISTFVESCLEYTPRDTLLPPVENSTFASEEVSPEMLVSYSPEETRKTLSVMLTRILSDDSSDVYDRYREFCKKYNYAVHQAFYRADVEGFSKWFDYVLQFPSAGQGNFGEVYVASKNETGLFAVKIMNNNVFSNDDMLGGFRRGVRSMRIVSDNHIDGMVPIVDAFELPPTIVMPFIGGLSLHDALDARPDLSWSTKLAILRRIGEIVASGHALSETILHRDLKPTNVMVRNFEYQGEFEPDIVVLDFDMSWHKGSSEKDVIFESRDDFGFLAPEQTDPSSGYTARSTRVDSYGFGMTIYYVFGLESPRANEPLSADWPARALRATKKGYNFDWISAPFRLARLIVRATAMEQIERVDFSTMVRELTDIYQSIRDVSQLINAEYWAEEVLARVGSSTAYLWDDARGSGAINSPNGVRVVATSDIKNKMVSISFEYTDAGMETRGNIPRFLRNNTDSAVHILKAAGWGSVRGEIIHGGLIITATTGIEDLAASNDLMDAPSEVFKVLSP